MQIMFLIRLFVSTDVIRFVVIVELSCVVLCCVVAIVDVIFVCSFFVVCHRAVPPCKWWYHSFAPILRLVAHREISRGRNNTKLVRIKKVLSKTVEEG